MYNTVSKRLNSGDELAAYSWDKIPGLIDSEKKRIIVPIISSHAVEEVYRRVVESGEGYVLPGIPGESLEGLKKSVKSGLEEAIKSSYGNGVCFIEEQGPERETKRPEIIFTNVGVVEEHGYHLPLDSDNIRPRGLLELAVEGDSELKEKSLILPSLSYGFVDSSGTVFPGTITIPPETLRDYVANYLTHWVKEYYPKRVFVLSGHYDDIHLGMIRLGMEKVKSEAGNDIDFEIVLDLKLTYPCSSPDPRYSKLPEKGHGNWIDISYFMALDKRLGTEFVNLSRAKPGKREVSQFKIYTEEDYKKTKGWESGVNGVVEGASLKIGDYYLDRIIKEFRYFVKTDDWRRYQSRWKPIPAMKS